jgi:arylformamidase
VPPTEPSTPGAHRDVVARSDLAPRAAPGPLARALAALWPAYGNYLPHRRRVRIEEDVAYDASAHAKQRLDLFLPRDPGPPTPSVLFVHGGAWRAQDRKLLRALSGLYSNVGISLAMRGIATCVLGYRQHPEVDGDGSLSDLRAALRSWRDRARSHGADGDRVVLVGHSAGGHLVTSLALSDAPESSSVAGVISLGGFYDTERLTRSLGPREAAAMQVMFGTGEAATARWSPERRVRATMPPLLLGVAEKEPPELRAEFEAMGSACRAVSARCATFEVAGRGHMGMVMAFGSARDEVSSRVETFVREVVNA